MREQPVSKPNDIFYRNEYYNTMAPTLITIHIDKDYETGDSGKEGDTEEEKTVLVYSSSTKEDGTSLFFYDPEGRRTFAKIPDSEIMIDYYLGGGNQEIISESGYSRD